MVKHLSFPGVKLHNDGMTRSQGVPSDFLGIFNRDLGGSHPDRDLGEVQSGFG